jgi:hypothetical protein
MKKIITLLFINFYIGNLVSQTWSTTGNAPTAAGQIFIGTTTNQDLDFKTNSTASPSIKMSLTKSGVLKITNLAGIGTRFVTVDASGNLVSGIASTNATATHVLYGNGTWGALPALQWTTTGANINKTTGMVGIGSAAVPTATLDVTGNGKFSTNISSPIHLFNSNNGFSWTQGINVNVGTFLYGKVVTPTLPTTSELTSSVKHKFAGGIKLFETDVNGNFPTTGSQLNIQPTIDGYWMDLIGTNKFLDINSSSTANKTRLWNNTILAIQEDYNAKALSVKVYDTGDETETFTIYGGGRTRIGGTPINAPVNFTNASLISSVGGINSGNVYNTILNTSNDLQKGLAIFKFNNTANSYTENFSVQGNGQTNIGQAGSNFGGTGSNNHILGVNGAMRIGGGLNYLTMHHDGGSNTINGFGPSTTAGINDLNIGQYSPMNVSIAANQPGYGNLSVFGNINANSNLNIGSPSTAASRLNILAPEGSTGIVSRTNHTGIYGYNTQLFTSKNMTKALAIQDEEITNAALRETFLVYGNGSTTINAETSNSNQAMLTINAANATNIYENKFVVYADGRTKIGNQTQTSGPHTDALLTINGKTVAKSLYITTSNWADHVFEPNYKLPTLYEIEAYYKANKHLPGIPPEKEVVDNGINIGEMNKLLLKKIEELTILMVGQQKEIDELKSKK